MPNFSRFRTTGLGDPFVGDLKLLVKPRMADATVSTYLARKNLPAIRPELTADPDAVANTIGAIPAAYFDASRGSTTSAMVACEDIFANFQDMDAAYPWAALSVRDARAILRDLAEALKATNSLTDLADYAAVEGAQRLWLFWLLRAILDDLHGSNPDAHIMLRRGRAYPALTTAADSFAATVMAHVSRVAPWILSNSSTDAGADQQHPPNEGSRRNPEQDDEADKPRKERKRKRKQRRRRSSYGDSSNSDTSGSDSSGSDSDSASDHDVGGNHRQSLSSAALVASLCLTKHARLDGKSAINVLTTSMKQMENVNDIESFVTTLTTVANSVTVDTGQGDTETELKATALFQAVERHLGGPVTADRLNDTLLSTIRVIIDKARKSRFKRLHKVAERARKRIKGFTQDASKETNLSKLRGCAGRGFVELSLKEQQTTSAITDRLDRLDKALAQNTNGGGGGGGSGGGRGGGGGKPTPKRGKGLLPAFIDLIVKKKEMSRNAARNIALDMAERKCIGCLAPVVKGRCTKDCNGSEVHATLVAKLAERTLH